MTQHHTPTIVILVVFDKYDHLWSPFRADFIFPQFLLLSHMSTLLHPIKTVKDVKTLIHW